MLMVKWVLVDVGEAFDPSKQFWMGHRNCKKCCQCANIIRNNVGGGVFIPQINKIKAYYSHDRPLPITLILSFAMSSNKSKRVPLVLSAIVSSNYFRHDQVYDVLKWGRIHQNFSLCYKHSTSRKFYIVVPCIVILGWKNPTRCKGMQIFIYC